MTDRAPRASGYAILLTNDPSYWTQSRNDNTADVRFRLHEGNTLHGGLGWGPGASAGTKCGREELFQLGGPYALGRFGEPDELVGAAIWLCSPAASFVNGAVIPVDGGFGAFSGV